MTLNKGIYSIEPEEYQSYMRVSHKEYNLEKLDAIIRMLIFILVLVVLFFTYKGFKKSQYNTSFQAISQVEEHPIQIEKKNLAIQNKNIVTTKPIENRDKMLQSQAHHSETIISDDYIILMTKELNH